MVTGAVGEAAWLRVAASSDRLRRVLARWAGSTVGAADGFGDCDASVSGCGALALGVVFGAASSRGVPRSAAKPRPNRRSLVTFEYLHAKFDVSPCAARSRSVRQNGLTVAWGFADRAITWDGCIKNDVSEEIPNFVIDFGGQLEPRVDHGEQDSAEGEGAGVLLHDVPDDVDHLGESFHGEVLALDGHEDFGAGCQGGLCQFTERGWAIDENAAVATQSGLQVLSQ